MTDKEIYHVYPVSDTFEHLQHVCFVYGNGPEYPVCKCKCHPNILEEPLGLIVVHNSFDGREGVEWTNEIFKDNAI